MDIEFPRIRPLQRLLLPLVAVLVPLAGARPAAAQSAEEVMERLEELKIGFMGIATDIPDRQYLGERGSEDDNQSAAMVYMWDREATPDDAVAREHLLTVESLQRAGIPAVHGSEPDFQEGMAGPNRYRMAGVLTNLDIRGEQRYEIRSSLDWHLFDTETSEVVWSGSSRGMARGAVLGDRGQMPNTLLDSVLNALGKVLEKEVPDAMK